MIDMSKIDDELLAYGALKNDLLFHKIPKEKYNYYICKSIKFGKEKAKKNKNHDVRELCNSNHIEISFAKNSGKFYGVQFRANIEMSDKKKKIIIYKDSLEEVTRVAQKYVDSSITFKDVEDIHLAHELYHFYEYVDDKQTNENLDYIERMHIGPVKLKASVMASCEIAAHAFTKELLGLSYMPNLFDYILLMDQQKETLDDFYQMIETWKEELGG